MLFRTFWPNGSTANGGSLGTRTSVLLYKAANRNLDREFIPGTEVDNEETKRIRRDQIAYFNRIFYRMKMILENCLQFV